MYSGRNLAVAGLKSCNKRILSTWVVNAYATLGSDLHNAHALGFSLWENVRFLNFAYADSSGILGHFCAVKHV